MNLDKEQYIKNIIKGVYEVLYLANYSIKKTEEVVEKVKTVIVEDFDTMEIDLSDSHYAYVVMLLYIIDEWVTVDKNLDKTIKDALDKAYMNREVNIIEKEIISVLIEDFNIEV